MTIVLHAFLTRYLSYLPHSLSPDTAQVGVVTLSHRPIYPILPYEYFLTFVICLLGIMFCFLPLAFYILTFILFDFLPFDFYRF